MYTNTKNTNTHKLKYNVFLFFIGTVLDIADVLLAFYKHAINML